MSLLLAPTFLEKFPMRSMIQTICVTTVLLTGFAANPSFACKDCDKVTDKLAVPEAGTLAVTEMAAMLDRKEAVIVFDVNGRESYLKGHIPGAQWIEHDAVTATTLPKSKDAKLVFYCYNPLCGASPLAAKKAVSLGYRNVWLMPEGITGWNKAKLPVASGAKAG